jgi:Tol biopolymer transport system component
MPATGGPAEVLVPGSGPEADPNWSPDGSRIVYAPFPSDVPENLQAVFMIEVATRNAVKVRGSDGLWSPRWSPDGRYIAACTRNGAQLKVLDVETGQSKLLVPRVTHFPAWSRDGRYIYCTTPVGPEQEPTVVRVRVQDGDIHVVLKLGSADRAGNIGPWVGLTPDEQPMILRDLRTEDIYALQLAR